MIDFACKEFNLNEIIKCSLGLTKADYQLLDYLMKTRENSTTDDLAKKLGLDISTVQRSIKKLYLKKLVQRRQQNLDYGGYTYIYRIEDKKAIKKIIFGIVSNWTEKVEYELDRW